MSEKDFTTRASDNTIRASDNTIAVYRSEPVEVLDVWTAGGRKVAEIKSLNGQTWMVWTHGGWAETDTRTVQAGLLQPARQGGGR